MKRPALAPLLLAPIYFLLAPRLISWLQRRAADADGTVVGTSPTATLVLALLTTTLLLGLTYALVLGLHAARRTAHWRQARVRGRQAGPPGPRIK